MKKIFNALYLFCVLSTAQVGIGTVNPHSSSILHIESSDKGLLVPQVELIDVTNTTAPVNNPKVGLLIWNTNNSVIGGAGRGFYFYKNNIWNPFGIPEAWTIKGNNGTNPGPNFIGTTDNVELVFKVNDIERIRLEKNGAVSVKNTGNSVFIGANSGESDTYITDGVNANNTFIGISSGTKSKTVNNTLSEGKSNVGVGFLSLQNNLTGYNNISVGNQSLKYNDSGYENTAIGDYALKGDLDDVSPALGVSFQNVAIGSNAMNAMISGSLNTGIGKNVLYNNIDGVSNVAVGQLAGSNNINGSGNIFLGSQSGKNEMGSNKLYIHNSATSTPLIHGDFSTNILTVNGSLNTTNNLNISGSISNTSNNSVGGDLAVTNNTSTNTIKVGTNGSVLTDIIRFKTSNFNLADLAPGQSEIQTFLIPNAPIDATVFASPITELLDGIVIAYARVNVAGSVEVKFINSNTINVNNTATKLNITVIK